MITRSEIEHQIKIQGLNMTPQQVIYNRVAKYAAEHPGSSWKEIFDNVDNYFENHGSLEAAIGSYLRRRKEAWSKPIGRLRLQIKLS